MMTQPSPRPEEPDVHLSVQFHGLRLDFVACLTAAALFAREWRATHHADAAEIVPGVTAGLPRLPNERLYLE
ncbi:hypothetical protein ACFXNW_12880 [Nocardia sp. NPDC059180]|uniref:hypothetical protein n=1 Tax=Nocardia sp. NPDC059180 TaxID=3346761 RepID=UPI0036751C8E